MFSALLRRFSRLESDLNCGERPPLTERKILSAYELHSEWYGTGYRTVPLYRTDLDPCPSTGTVRYRRAEMYRTETPYRGSALVRREAQIQL